VPGPCEPEDLIDGIIFAANYLGSTQLLSERNPSKNIRMIQAQEAVSRVKVQKPRTSVFTFYFGMSFKINVQGVFVFIVNQMQSLINLIAEKKW